MPAPLTGMDLLTADIPYPHDYAKGWEEGGKAQRAGTSYDENPHVEGSILHLAWGHGWLNKAKQAGRDAYVEERTLSFQGKEIDRLQMTVYLRRLAQQRPGLISIALDCSPSNQYNDRLAEGYDALIAALEIVHSDCRVNMVHYAKSVSFYATEFAAMKHLKRFPDLGPGSNILPVIGMLNGEDFAQNRKQRIKAEQFKNRGYYRQGADANTPVIVLTDGEFTDTNAFDLFQKVGDDLFMVVL